MRFLSAFTGFGAAVVFIFPLCTNAAVLYEHDFSTDPGWITDNSASYHWDAAEGALYAKTINGPRGTSPDRYFAIKTPLDSSRPFTLTWRQKISSTGVYSVMPFGLLPPGLVGATSTGFTGGLLQGYIGNFNVFTLLGVELFGNNLLENGTSGITSKLHVVGRWYEGKIEHNTTTRQVTYSLTDSVTNVKVIATARSVAPPHQLGNTLQYIGTSMYALSGNRSVSAEHPDGFAEMLIDDVKLISEDTATISSLFQKRIDGVTDIVRGETFVGNGGVFGGVATTTGGKKVRLEIEVKPIDGLFTGTSTVFTNLVSSGEFTSVSIEALIPKDEHYVSGGNTGAFKWRARPVDEHGVVNSWMEFGTTTSPDFEIKVVPLVTQVRSIYPSDTLTQGWFSRDYAAGAADNLGDCGRSIGQCGCAISSMVMLGRYYDIQKGVDGTDSQPFNIDAWMLANNGYGRGGAVIWDKASEYLGVVEGDVKKKYLTLDEFNTTDVSLVDASLTNQAPVVAYSNRFGHYFVLDSKLASTYTVRDPRWYETKTLRDTRNGNVSIQEYNNVFTKANIFSYSAVPQEVAQVLMFRLASPAELVVTDPEGHKIGFDPSTNISYEQISDATYTREGQILSSETPISEETLHEYKIVRIPTPQKGHYAVEVIGTGNGPYTLTSHTYDENGNEKIDVVTATTSVNEKDVYHRAYLESEDRLPVLLMKLHSFADMLPKPWRVIATEAVSRIEFFINELKLKQAVQTIDVTLKQLEHYATTSTEVHEGIDILKELKSLLQR